MSVVRFTALRELTGGASLNDEITLDVILSNPSEMSREPISFSRTSLAGVRETYLYRSQVSWRCVTKPVTGQDSLNIIQFLASCEAQETFEFSPYDASTDSPIDWRDCVLEPAGFTQRRAIPKGGGGDGDYFSYDFTIVEA